MEPPNIEHAKMQWDGRPHIGNVVSYQCEEGYYTRGLKNYSVCGENGLWEDVDVSCEGAKFYDLRDGSLALMSDSQLQF